MRWNNIARTIQAIDSSSEPEQARYAILGYLGSILLKSPENDRIAKIMALFMNSYIYSGKQGLTLSCYQASKI